VHHFGPFGVTNILRQLGTVAICSRPHIKQAPWHQAKAISSDKATPTGSFQCNYWLVERTSSRRETQDDKLMATDVLSNKISIFECVIYNLQLRPIQTEDDAYKMPRNACTNNQYLICTAEPSGGRKTSLPTLYYSGRGHLQSVNAAEFFYTPWPQQIVE